MYEHENIINIDQLDCDFTNDEVLQALKSLKRGKGAGADLLIPEIFIDCKSILSPLMCKLFNYIFAKGIYPSSWCSGVTVPVPKRGDLSDVNNYRGITLTSVFSKIFSILLDTRLRKWAESNNLLSDYQFGFRKDKSTTDCIFVLTSIINKIIKQEKRKLYVSMIDFRKCF